jgi:ribosomal protein S18 acetylase RimI-like enzyme
MWSITPAAADDAASILAVQQAAFAQNQRRYTATLPQLRETVDDVSAAIAEGGSFVARQRDEVIGAVRVHVHPGSGEAEVSHLAVRPAYAHLAVGRSLMAAAEEAAQAAGARAVVLRTGLRDAAAIEFYLKQGYRPEALLPDPATEIDLVRFRRAL